jgi:hypothetical protein
LEAAYRDYKDKNVDFYFVYKALAHPQGNGFVRPTTLKERLKHVEVAKKSLGATIPWIVDTMDNQLKHAMGDRPNSEFIIGPDGTIVRMRDWSSADAVRADLDELVGKPDRTTDPRDLNMRTSFEQTEVARGVVARVSPGGGMTPLKVQTDQPKGNPAYMKLRAEGSSDGKLYLGFFVDPIHKVHWNNLAGPVQVEVNGETHTGPKVQEKADADPREFVIDIGDDPVNVTLKYVACDDKETWCRKLTQTFVVTQERDPDAGRVSGQRPVQRPVQRLELGAGRGGQRPNGR